MNGWVDRLRTHELACYYIENSAMRLKNCISQNCLSQRAHLPSQVGRIGKRKRKRKLKYYVYVSFNQYPSILLFLLALELGF